MGRAKEIIVKVIPSKIANEFVRKWHYSGRPCYSVIIHLGCFLDDSLHGVIQLGRPFDKRRVLGLIENTGWNEMLELNRMAFDDYLPKNSESRCISIAVKLLKKNAPHIKWILSFADGAMCGDGAIYRASGFMLTNIKENRSIMKTPSGINFTSMTFTNKGQKGSPLKVKEVVDDLRKGGATITETGAASVKQFKEAGCFYVPGNQLRYIYLIDKSCKITVSILPYSKIDEMGAGMYKGKRISIKERNAVKAQEKCAEQSCSEVAFETTSPL